MASPAEKIAHKSIKFVENDVDVYVQVLCAIFSHFSAAAIGTNWRKFALANCNTKAARRAKDVSNT